VQPGRLHHEESPMTSPTVVQAARLHVGLHVQPSRLHHEETLMTSPTVVQAARLHVGLHVQPSRLHHEETPMTSPTVVQAARLHVRTACAAGPAAPRLHNEEIPHVFPGDLRNHFRVYLRRDASRDDLARPAAG
jgi:hypothetical protein